MAGSKKNNNTNNNNNQARHNGSTTNGKGNHNNATPHIKLEVNTDVAPVTLLTPAAFDGLSPRVRQVAEHAALLKKLLDQVTPIYDMVGREAKRMADVSSAAKCSDKLGEMSTKLTEIEGKRVEVLEKLQKRISEAKEKFIKSVETKITKIIRECVASQVAKIVEEKIRKQTEEFHKAVLVNRGRMLRFQMALNNVNARNSNAIIRSKFPKEHLQAISRPISVNISAPSSPTASPGKPRHNQTVSVTGPSPSEKFPRTFEDLLRLEASEAKKLVSEYELPESQKESGEARLEHINQLMSHFGIGYRLNAAGPMSFLTSVWDR